MEKTVTIDNGLLESPCLNCRRRRRSKLSKKCLMCNLPEKYDDIISMSYGIWSREGSFEYQRIDVVDFHAQLI